MEKYIKDNEILEKNRIVLTINNRCIYNPTHNQLIENGWNLYEEPKMIPLDLLNTEKIKMIDLIKCYDTSENVNSFTINGDEIWLNKNTRAGLMLRFTAEKNQNLSTTTLWYNNKEYTFEIDTVIQMLYKLECYASKCYDNTQKNIKEVNSFDNITDVISFDYTKGYPDKLIFIQ